MSPAGPSGIARLGVIPTPNNFDPSGPLRNPSSGCSVVNNSKGKDQKSQRGEGGGNTGRALPFQLHASDFGPSLRPIEKPPFQGRTTFVIISAGTVAVSSTPLPQVVPIPFSTAKNCHHY
ncbi:unnamed protein product [Amoebophrya sp. A120]|nr:unnamed protein product [Amoebophrya sp. A120]|eukprot:GSA120T00023865001.1